MHELAIAQNIVEVVEQSASRCQAARVKNVRLQVGEASGIVADSLTFSFEMLTSLSPRLEGACLQIEVLPHLAHCQQCGQAFAVKNFVPQCPTCEVWSAEIISGTELQILEMEIEYTPISRANNGDSVPIW
jgi:hydrogenase nickel incorporation protein HypA/HybF